MKYSEQQLKLLAKNSPTELVRILLSSSDIKTLSSGIEILSMEVIEENTLLPIYRLLLKHIHMTVREGTLMGIEAYYNNKLPPQDILDRLIIISSNDPAISLREYSKDILNRFK